MMQTNMTGNMAKLRVTIPELAKRWGYNRRTIERKIQQRQIPLPTVFLGRRVWLLDTIRQFEQQHFGRAIV